MTDDKAMEEAEKIGREMGENTGFMQGPVALPLGDYGELKVRLRSRIGADRATAMKAADAIEALEAKVEKWVLNESLAVASQIEANSEALSNLQRAEAAELRYQNLRLRGDAHFMERAETAEAEQQKLEIRVAVGEAERLDAIEKCDQLQARVAELEATIENVLGEATYPSHQPDIAKTWSASRALERIRGIGRAALDPKGHHPKTAETRGPQAENDIEGNHRSDYGGTIYFGAKPVTEGEGDG